MFESELDRPSGRTRNQGVASETDERKRPGPQRDPDERFRDGLEEREREHTDGGLGAHRVHAEREDQSPIIVLVDERDALEKVPPHPEHEQDRYPPGRGRPEQVRGALQEGQQVGEHRTSARVEMAIAPMLIQYGGVRSPGASDKKRMRWKMKTISHMYSMLPTSQNARATKSSLSGASGAKAGTSSVASTLTAWVPTTTSSQAPLSP